MQSITIYFEKYIKLEYTNCWLIILVMGMA